MMFSIMLVLPIVVREMQEAAHRRSTFWVRLLTAVLALGVTLAIVLFTYQDKFFERGMTIFVALSLIAWLLAMLSGLWLTSDSISAEKRQGTLGLLFLTDLRRHDIVLGKLSAHLLQSLCCLLALIPILCLPLLMGGRTAEGVGRVALAIWAAFLFSLSTGLAVSACFVRAKVTFLVTAGILVGITVVIPWLIHEMDNIYPLPPVVIKLMCLSPIYGIWHGLDLSTDLKRYWWSIEYSHALAVVALLIARWRLAYSWQDTHVGFRKGSWREWWHRFWTGGPGWRQAFRQKALEVNPCYWLVSRDRWGPWLVWYPVVIAAAWWGYEIWDTGWWWVDDEVRFTTACSLAIFYKAWFAWRAAAFLGEARREQTMEFWLTAPVPPEEILWGQWQALWRMFRGPFIFMVLLFIAFGIWYIHERFNWDNSWAYNILTYEITNLEFIGLYYYGVVSLFDLAALGWLSMWLSLRLARPHRAAMCAIGLVMSLPWVLWLFGMAGLLALRTSKLGNFLYGDFLNLDWMDLAASGTYLAIHIGMDLLLIFYARWRLRRDFRILAATPVGLKPLYHQGR